MLCQADKTIKLPSCILLAQLTKSLGLVYDYNSTVLIVVSILITYLVIVYYKTPQSTLCIWHYANFLFYYFIIMKHTNS